MPNQLDFVFFDIGGTLGDGNAAGKFVAFPSTAGLLQSMRELALRVGIITTLGPQLSNAEALDMLEQSGLSQFLDPQGFVPDHDAGVAKPNPEIYRLAAQRAGVEISRCLVCRRKLGRGHRRHSRRHESSVETVPARADLPS
ncbi:MAG TPA: HAD family hydrolase [Pyrinomonadaceae bacterium]|jgi:FMN phosphatase YigB (HAD superfamily)